MNSKDVLRGTLVPAALVLLLSRSSGSQLHQARAASGANGMIVPIYGWNSNFESLVAAKAKSPQVPIIAVINPASGPGSSKDSHWQDIINQLHSVGIQVVGYVATGYGTSALWNVDSQIDSYYSWYQVDGVFFDQVSPNGYSYYSNAAIHAKTPNASKTVILNLGAPAPASYATFSDVVIAYENGQIPASINSNGISSSELGVLIHDVSDSATVFSLLHAEAKYIYTARDWIQVASDITEQVARMS